MSSSSLSSRPPLWKVWFVAARPHTLSASIAPNIVAYNVGIAIIDNVNKASFFWFTMEWTLFCILMQLGTNLHNDYADFVKGADNEKRVGQARATQKGWLTPFQTAMASGLTLLVGLILGIRFVINIATTTTTTAHIMVFIVVTSIFNAFAYTGGPWPLGYIGLPNFSLGYSGLGDIFVFLYFGLVATMMPPFLYISSTDNNDNDDDDVSTLATNIIVVNNLRDRFTDVLANKLTLAVRFGATFCRVEYGINIFVAYGITVWRWWWWSSAVVSNNDSTSLLMLLPLLSFPLALKEWQALYRKDGGALNPHVGGAAKVQLLFCILLAISIRISR
ncbi:hypothetical protein FRACYDRAFT_173266 [Fragilariopsis cylindrus CCMP1102]|uniref:UbiA prenyltransferase n=1 Tax=Fragilariopsis cylindrus CCMP1102 TaxID=635003 RepID=A0A1E7EW63_9STRA|nr:hypothetical protein FRACYDRAFT_173266 [Fragilariopsis cylindrus CCMP1102]|eukprot:OEU10079.1 hypothetical protein FRACYDRAFT_173266 [Fragilariopsis cylindrus CCMP1102]